MDYHTYCAGLIVIGLLCLLTVAVIWAIASIPDDSFVEVLTRNAELNELLNAELEANERLLNANQRALERDLTAAQNALHPSIIICRDEAEVAPGVW